MNEARGSVSVVMLGLMAFVIATALMLVRVGRLQVASRVAVQAADAAALAAAEELALGNGCDASRDAAVELARANHAFLIEFRCGDHDVTTGVRVQVEGGSTVIRRARAIVEPCVRCG